MIACCVFEHLKIVFNQANETLFIWDKYIEILAKISIDKYCRLMFCLHLMKQVSLSRNSQLMTKWLRLWRQKRDLRKKSRENDSGTDETSRMTYSNQCLKLGNQQFRIFTQVDEKALIYHYRKLFLDSLAGLRWPWQEFQQQAKQTKVIKCPV